MHATRRLILTAAAGLTLMMSGITAATAADEPAKGPNGLPILKVGTSGTFPPFEFHNSTTRKRANWSGLKSTSCARSGRRWAATL